MASKEIIQDLILRGFKVSSICEQLNIEMKEAKEFSIHPSRQEIAAYQIAHIREHYSKEQILEAFLELKRTEDLQTKVNRLEYFTLGCAFGLYKTVFETLLGREQFGILSRQFRKEKTEKTVMERYGVASVSLSPEVLKKREQTKIDHMRNPKPKKEPNIVVTEELAEQVRDLTLRGFNRRYIRSKLNLSQPAMKQIGFYPSRDEIVAYQVRYIGEHYSIPEIRDALKAIHETEDFQAKANRHELHSLGCSFGSITQPFSKLLGVETYKEIVCGITMKKMKASGTLEESHRKRRETMLERYGVESPNQNREIAERMLSTMRKTNMERYGVESAMKCPEIAARANEERQKSMMAIYGAANSVQIPEIREKIQESRRQNGTMQTSIFEVEAKKLLVEVFGEDDVVHSMKIDDRYPYYVDFYIKSRDLFIEMNTDVSHRGHWFDPDSELDQLRLSELQNKITTGNRSSRYRNFIRVWTETDPEKRACAKKNGLNYLVFWDNGFYTKDGKQYPKLWDLREWINAGCPDPKDWPGHEGNKY